MRAQFRVESDRKRSGLTSGDICLHISNLAHARDDSGDSWIIEDEAKRHLRHGHAVRDQWPERLSVCNAGGQVFRNEIAAAPVACRPSAVKRDTPRKSSFIERDAGDYRDVVRSTSGEKFVFKVLIKNVINDLDTINQPRFDRTHAIAGFPAVQADAKCMNQSLSAQIVHLVYPSVVIHPRVIPRMKLKQIKAL